LRSVTINLEKEYEMENNKVNLPKKNAGRKWAKRLKELSKLPPPEELIKRINEEDHKKVALPEKYPNDLDI
jgi:hypothetical protein